MPIWYRNRNSKRIRCEYCRELQRGCSLGSRQDLGVTKWPTVLNSPAGNAAREADATKKREQKARTAKARSKRKVRRVTKSNKVEDSGEGGGDDVESIPTLALGRDCSPAVDHPGVSSWRTPNTSITSLPVLGRTHHLHLESFVPFAAVLENPERTSLAVECSRVEIQAFLEREAATLKTLITLVQGRRVIGKALLERMDEEIATLNGVPLDELASSPELFLRESDEEDEGDEGSEGVEEPGSDEEVDESGSGSGVGRAGVEASDNDEEEEEN